MHASRRTCLHIANTCVPTTPHAGMPTQPEAWSVVKGNFPPRSLSSLRELRDALVGYSTDYPVRERSTSRCWGLRLLLLLGGSSIAFQSQLSLSLSSYKRRDEGIHWIYGWNPNRNLRSECSSWVLLCVGSRIYICVGARMYICIGLKMYICIGSKMYICVGARMYICSSA